MIKKTSFILFCFVALFVFAACSAKKSRYFKSDLAFGEKEMNIAGVELRIKKNDTIWINARAFGHTLVRAIATKDGVTMYERLGKTISHYPWSKISDNRHINYKNIEKIFLGKGRIKSKNFSITNHKAPDGSLEKVVITIDNEKLEMIYKNPQWKKTLALPFSPPENYDTLSKDFSLNL